MLFILSNLYTPQWYFKFRARWLSHHQVLLRFHCRYPPKTDHLISTLDLFILFPAYQLEYTDKTLLRSFKVLQEVSPYYIPNVYGSLSCSLLSNHGKLTTISLHCLKGRAGCICCGTQYKIKMQIFLLKIY